MTILFADIVGFTTLSERLDAEDVRDLTSECFRRLVAEVTRFEGTVDKFIGDAVMVLFGAPAAHDDDPVRALWSALGMQRALIDFNRGLEKERGLRLALRIGVETGEVVAGVRDIGGFHEYTVIGDTVNVAARLQAATMPDTVLVGPVTRRRAEAHFEFQPVPPLTLKGKDRPVQAALLIAPRELSGSGPPIVWQAPLVGRTREIGLLETALNDLRLGHGHIQLLIGEPGLGKSRLLAELRERALSVEAAAANTEKLQWIRSQAFAHEETSSYALARNLVRALLRLGRDEPEASASERLRRQLNGLDMGDAYGWLAQLLGLSTDQSDSARLASLAAQELQHLTFQAVARLIARTASEAPLVIELDDVHWADPTSVDLLLEIFHVAERAAVLYLLALRPERDTPAWSLREHAARHLPHRSSELVVHALTDDESAELVRQLLQTEHVGGELREFLERAAGTPLWVEELVRALVERGLLVRGDAGWALAADLNSIDIPNTLQALIVARIDRLGEARPTLQAASVIGRQFSRRVLERVAADHARLDDDLVRAQRADLIREMASIPEREYGFRHVLTQEAAYATLLIRRRRELHHRAAQAMEHLYEDRLDELRPALAHHYVRAEEWDKALEHARGAAQSARASYANREAIEHYGQALLAAEKLGASADERMALYEARADVHALIGQFEPARQDYEAALAIADALGQSSARARLLQAQGMLWGGHKDYQRGLTLTREAVRAARDTGDLCAQAGARVQVAIMLINLARAMESRRELEEALAIFRQLGDEPGQAQCLDALTMANTLSGNFDKVLSYGCEAITRLETLGDRGIAASSMAMVGHAYAYQGDHDAAMIELNRAISIWKEIGAPAGESFGQLVIAQIAEQFGDYELAYHAASRGLSIAREIAHLEWTAANLSYLGRVYRCCGDALRARELHEESLAIARELAATLWIAHALGELGQDLAMITGESGGAPLLAEAVQTGGEAHFFTAPAQIARAGLALRNGRAEEALVAAQAFQESLDQFRVLAIDARRIEGEALAALGRVAEAEAVLRTAQSQATAMRALPPFWRSSLALGRLLAERHRARDAASEYAEAYTALEQVGQSLSDERLRTSFFQTEEFRRVREARDLLS